MKNIKTKPFALFIFALFAICFVGMALGTGAEIRDVWSALKTAYKTIPLILLLWMVFVLYAWKWKVFQKWLVPFPCIDGTWQGSIQTTWKNPNTGVTPGPIPVIWCDMMLRQWPVAAVICENGAFALMRDAQNTIHTLTHPNAARDPAPRLEALARAVRAAVPEARISRDQRFRAYDLAFDFAEDEPRLPDASVEAILAACRREGAQCKLSSIHVNAWYGEYDKLSMTLNYFEHEKVENARSHALFFGDSPNDEPMFAYFPNACGVENVLDYAHSMASMPAYIVKGRGGQGFARAARTLIEKVGGVYDPGL